MAKRTKKTRRKKSNKNIRRILLAIILVLIVFTVFYSFNKTTWQNIVGTPKNEQVQIPDVAIYPGSVKKLYTEDGDRITINYQTKPDVDYHEVISFYRQNLPKLGWQLVSSSDIDAVFEKGTKKLRVWILYLGDIKDRGVDYIIDYSGEKKQQPQLN